MSGLQFFQMAGLGAADYEGIVLPAWQAAAEIAEPQALVTFRILADQTKIPEPGTPAVQLCKQSVRRRRACPEVELKLDNAFKFFERFYGQDVD